MVDDQTTPVEQRLDDFAKLVETASPQTLERDLRALFTPENFKRKPVERRITTFMNWKMRGGFDCVNIEEVTETSIEVIATHPVTQEHWRLRVEVEADPPHCIDALLLGRAPLPVAKEVGADHDVARAYISYVGHLAKANLFSGAVLIGRHGHILGQQAFGYANQDFDIHNKIDTRFNVASLNKSWTAIAICQLIEAGILGFDTRLSEFLNFPTHDVAQTIEIRHLLSHTSGLGGYFNDSFNSTPRGRIRELDDFLALAKDDAPTFAPGTAWNYSNIGMILLGKVIEAVTGTPYPQHVADHVMSPAGMHTAEFLQLDHVNKGIAVGYHHHWTPAGRVNTNALFEWAVKGAPDGCAYATVGDIWNFSQAFLGGKLVSRVMVETMTTPKLDLSSPDYGYGMAIHPERALFGHSGGLIGASANIDMTMAPEGWVIVVLANDLSMRAPVLMARKLVGVSIPEAGEARAYLPRSGMTAR